MANICVGLFFAVLKPLLLLAVLVSLLPLVPNVPPNFQYTSFRAPEPPVLGGKLALNKYLNDAERLFEGEIKGPEAFAVLNGELYTSLHGGFVAKVTGNEIHPVVKFGKSCESWIEEDKCGRPLGLFAGADDFLYVADAYYGIYQYDVNSGKSTQLIGPNEKIEGRIPKIFNSIAVAADGTIYWTDSSTDVSLKDGLLGMLADGTGRLLKFDPVTKKNTVLIDGLVFANGVALSPDESFLVVAETGMSRLHRYWLSGPKKGTYHVFGNTLPGLPDNLRSGSKGFLVSVVLASDDGHPALSQIIYPFPYIRKALSRAIATVEFVFQKIGEFYPNVISDRAVHFLGHFEMISALKPSRVTLVILDLEGRVTECFHGTNGAVSSISDAIVFRGQLLLGSPFNNYLGRVRNPTTVAKFQDVFPTVPKVSIRVKPTTTTTERPTTTTTMRTTTAGRTTTTSTPPSPPKTQSKPATPKSTTTTVKPTTTEKPVNQKQASSTPRSTATTPQPPVKKVTSPEKKAPKTSSTKDSSEL